jgi:hypothetical protein
MTLEEERNYWKELVGEMVDNMDQNIITSFEWEKIAEQLAEQLAEHIKFYLDWPENKQMLDTYITLNEYYNLKKKSKRSCNTQQLDLI